MSELKKNQKKAFDEAEKIVNKTEKDIVRIYLSSLKSIRSNMMKLDEKVTAFTLAEVRKYGRLESLEEQILKELKKTSKSVYDVMKQNNTIITYNTYNRSWFGYTKETDVFINLTRINPDVVRQIVLEPYPNIKLSDMIKDVSINQAQRIKFEIGQGLLLGESSANISKRIKNALNIGANRSIKIARTEGLRASSKSQLIATENATKAGIEIVKIWDATLDSRTRSRHRAMDGRKSNKKGEFSTAGGVSMGQAPRLTGRAEDDIFCRCSYLEEIVDLDESVEKRKDNITKELIDKMTYDQWLNERVKK
jgi:uncharacterized protein with gpF-like domain